MPGGAPSERGAVGTAPEKGSANPGGGCRAVGAPPPIVLGGAALTARSEPWAHERQHVASLRLWERSASPLRLEATARRPRQAPAWARESAAQDQASRPATPPSAQGPRMNRQHDPP
eukprot:9594042-Alexandrium_andersonii.AAC.1